MARLLVLFLIFGGAILFVLTQMFNFFFGISGGRSALTRDQKRLEDLLEQYELDPIELDELDILSHQFKEKERRRLFSTTRQGVCLSIFQEPIIAYASKSYHNSDRRIVTIKIGSDIFHFKVKAREAEICKGDRLIGKIKLKETLEYSGPLGQLSLNKSEKRDTFPVVVNGRQLWSVSSSREFGGQHGRILRATDKRSKEEDQLVLIFLAFALADKQI